MKWYQPTRTSQDCRMRWSLWNLVCSVSRIILTVFLIKERGGTTHGESSSMWRRFTNSGSRQDRRRFLRQVVDGYLIERTSQLLQQGSRLWTRPWTTLPPSLLRRPATDSSSIINTSAILHPILLIYTPEDEDWLPTSAVLDVDPSTKSEADICIQVDICYVRVLVLSNYEPVINKTVRCDRTGIRKPSLQLQQKFSVYHSLRTVQLWHGSKNYTIFLWNRNQLQPPQTELSE